MDDPHRVDRVETLEALYEAPLQRALDKELDHVSPAYRAFIDAAPFFALATSGPEGLDCSPRGDPAGFVDVVDPRTLLIPDRRGNNRLDSLRNIVRDPRVALLFLIPGVGETLRVAGRAEIRTDPDLRARFAIRDRRPAVVLRVAVERVYYQCPKALVRSRLWDPGAHVERSRLPSSGEMLAAASPGPFDAAAHDRDYPAHLRRTIY